MLLLVIRKRSPSALSRVRLSVTPVGTVYDDDSINRLCGLPDLFAIELLFIAAADSARSGKDIEPKHRIVRIADDRHRPRTSSSLIRNLFTVRTHSAHLGHHWITVISALTGNELTRKKVGELVHRRSLILSRTRGTWQNIQEKLLVKIPQ